MGDEQRHRVARIVRAPNPAAHMGAETLAADREVLEAALDRRNIEPRRLELPRQQDGLPVTMPP